MSGISADAGSGATVVIARTAITPHNERPRTARMIPGRCRNRRGRARRALILDAHRSADGDAIIEVDHVLIGHAEAAGGHSLPDGLGLVGAVDAVERRSQINRARAERILDAARHMDRQGGGAPAPFPRGGPAPPLPPGRATGG